MERVLPGRVVLIGFAACKDGVAGRASRPLADGLWCGGLLHDCKAEAAPAPQGLGAGDMRGS